MSIYNKNLEALSINNQFLYEYLHSGKSTDVDHVKVEFAKNGDIIINSHNVYLNSRYNPSAEAEKYMQDMEKLPDEAILVMFGLANGAFAKAFLQMNKKNTHCLVVEPDIEIFVQVMKNIDITDLLTDNRFQLIVYGINDRNLEQVMSGLLKSYNKNTNQHIAAPKYGQLYPDKLNAMITVLNEQYDRQKIEYNTLIQNGIKGCKNSFYNARFFENCRSSDDLIGRIPVDMPAIVVSAGPSLAKNVHLLEKAKGKAFIICTDTAINAVLATGIKPDMVIGVDYEKPLELFMAQGLSDIPFLADTDFNTEVLEYVQPKNLFFSTSDERTWQKLFLKVGSSFTSIDAGGSVATAAISSLVKWGIKKIILIGQDLALTGNKEHVGDVEEVTEFDERHYKFIEGIDGDILPVRFDFLIYLRWIEELAFNNKDIEIIDATEGGIKKRNTSIMSLEAAIDKFCGNIYDIDGILESVPRLFTGESSRLIVDELQQMKNNLKRFIDDFSKVVEYCKEGSDMLTRGCYDIKRLKEINAFMGEVDDFFVNSDEALFVNKFMGQAEEQMADDFYIEEENEIDEAVRMYNKSASYYKMLADAIPELVSILEETEKYLTDKKE
ncbi:MAG: motility associated factor glycosyltransferase family protein [Lachnospiraceae bacterium]|nr:motility associated factor glycosyltransferase family protein [Lachnospiraceae bacterium]